MTAYSLTIGRLSALTGVKVTTIRYYESVGLLPAPPRSEGNRRLYGPEHVDTLAFIRRSRAFGLAPEAIRDMLALERDVAGSRCRASPKPRLPTLSTGSPISRLCATGSGPSLIIAPEPALITVRSSVPSTAPAIPARGADPAATFRRITRVPPRPLLPAGRISPSVSCEDDCSVAASPNFEGAEAHGLSLGKADGANFSAGSENADFARR